MTKRFARRREALRLRLARRRPLLLERAEREEFARAVLDVLPWWRFSPAVLGGCAVKVRVRQSSVFSVRR